MTPPAQAGTAPPEDFHGNKHPYHLVEPSPWPLVGAMSALVLFGGAVMFMHEATGGAAVMGAGLIAGLATMIIPTAALVVLMSPIVLSAMGDLGLQPETAMMAIAMAASASFTSPISHPANILVMGPGGYRFVDYLKIGVPLTLVIFVVVMVGLPIFWPLTAVQ